MEKKVIDFMLEHHMLEGAARVTLAVSGGADSMAMAHLVVRAFPDLSFTVAHVHHGLRPEADGDEALVRDFAQSHGLDFRGLRVDIAALAEERGQGVEETGREERYRFFRSLGSDLILTAHHKDDQAETVLLHLLRGSGLKGLCGMSPLSGDIGRPLLAVTKEEILAYCGAKAVPYREDASNADIRYTRNKIRSELLPKMAEINPSVTEALCRLSAAVKDDAAYLDALAEKGYVERRQTRENGVFLPLSVCSPGEPALARRRLRLAAAEVGAALSFDRTDAVLALAPGKRLPLTTGRWVYREREGFFFGEERRIPDFAGDFAAVLTPETPVTLPDGRRAFLLPGKKGKGDVNREGYFPRSLFDENPPELRFRRPGDYVARRGGRKKLSRWLIDEKIPSGERDGLLLLTAGRRVLWVVGKAFFAEPAEVSWHVVFVEKNH